jgi:hypothetical protein
MKYSNRIGILAAFFLIIACFLPWAFYPDLDKTFTGFFSEKNFYGRPGKLLTLFALFSVILFIIPRIWAKRLNILITVLTLSFAVKSYLLFTACYQGICPLKKPGIFIILITPLIMLLCAVLPDLKLKAENK